MALKLQHRHFPAPGKPMLIALHGLLGSSRNWTTAGKALAEHFDTYALDLRNHGGSPHADEMSYPAMAQDVLHWMDSHSVRRALLVGHSLGGKTAMQVACDAPERLTGLVVVDIAPVSYPPRWEKEFAAMRALDLRAMRSRADAEAELAKTVSDWAFRKFLVTNLERDTEHGGLRWMINLDRLHQCLPQMFGVTLADDMRHDGATLFLRGEHSRFVRDEHIPAIHRYFPNAAIRTIPDSGHNIHFDNLSAFVTAILDWHSARRAC